MVPNCPWCQIVHFYPWCQIVRRHERCQIVRGAKMSWCQIVLGPWNSYLSIYFVINSEICTKNNKSIYFRPHSRARPFPGVEFCFERSTFTSTPSLLRLDKSGNGNISTKERTFQWKGIVWLSSSRSPKVFGVINKYCFCLAPTYLPIQSSLWVLSLLG